MAEGNGQQDNLSRLDRIERAMELLLTDHEQFREEHKMLLRSQVVLQGAMEFGFRELRENIDHLSSKIDLLVDGIDRDHREFHERLKRLEEKQ
jgi:hypothetical protein